ncbi:MAG: hypothetical protein Ct9H300mP17_03200 [Candidatus Nitrosopelagicus sp.]|nr:MAG: hypothetical protein Ct9H300mP17_03200 [Candidatus Nitrosopelagicus sp.]
MPKPVTEPKDIEKLVIVKRQGAAGVRIFHGRLMKRL